MSWSRIKATGAGKLRLRLAISGFAHAAVSDSGMVADNATDGRTWRAGLKSEAVIISERCSPIEVVPRSSSVSFEIVDVAGYWTSVFAREPSKVTWLSADLATAATTANVASETGWAANDYAYIGLEAIKVGGTAAGQLTSLTRAQFNSTAITHYAESATAELRSTEITDRPRTLIGRDALLYAYGEGDSATGAGTLIWRGIISQDPELNGTTWTLEADSTVRLLGQTLGEGLKERIPARGIRYTPYAPIRVTLVGRNAAYHETSGVENRAEVSIGRPTPVHYETQEEFCDALADALNSAVSGWTNVPTFRVFPNGSEWDIWIQTAATARYVNVHVESALDGETRRDYWRTEDGEPIGEHSGAAVAAATLYRVHWRDNDHAVVNTPRMVPRGTVGPVRAEYEGYPPTVDAVSRRVYLGGGEVSLTGVEVVHAEWPEWDREHRNLRNPVTYIDAVDTSDRFITLTASTPHAWSGDPPMFKITREIVRAGHLGNVVDTLITDAKVESARGGAPYVTADHLGDFSTPVSAAARGRPLILERNYTIGSAVELKDLLVGELRLAGLWLGFDSAGALRPLTFEVPVATDPDLTDITPLRTPRPTWQYNKFGTIGGARLELGYDPHEDKWAGPIFNIRDVTSLSRNPLGAIVDVKPRSTYGWRDSTTSYGWRDATTFSEAAELMAPLLGAFGYPYQIVTLDVPLTAFDVLLGSGVRFDSPYLPDVTTGTRGVTDAVGLVVGRTINLRAGRITLELYVWNGAVRGYAPAVGITGQTNVSGNTWDLTVAFSDPDGTSTWHDGDVPSDHFAASDAVEVYRWNTASSIGTLTGSVVSVTDPSTIRVTFTGAWTPGGAGTEEWVLRYQAAAAADASMQKYAYWAAATRRIAFSTAAPARVFGP